MNPQDPLVSASSVPESRHMNHIESLCGCCDLNSGLLRCSKGYYLQSHLPAPFLLVCLWQGLLCPHSVAITSRLTLVLDPRWTDDHFAGILGASWVEVFPFHRYLMIAPCLALKVNLIKQLWHLTCTNGFLLNARCSQRVLDLDPAHQNLMPCPVFLTVPLAFFVTSKHWVHSCPG